MFFASCFESERPEILQVFPVRDFDEIITTVDITENKIIKVISKLKPSKSQEPAIYIQNR